MTCSDKRKKRGGFRRRISNPGTLGCIVCGILASLLFAWLMLGVEVAPARAGGKTFVKFSTLAPEGSSWMNQMHVLAGEIEKATQGRVGFKFYPGGVSGDEIDVIRKMRIGQVHAAGFTGVGLGEILPEVRVLDLPFLFRNDREIKHIYEKMNDYFAAGFERKGFILLGWVPVGWVHFFSTHPIRTLEDLRNSKAWMWEGDPLVQATYRQLGVSPHSLSVTDVLLSLQTGMIDTVYASPMGALALQWFTKVRYMSELRMGNATGGVLMSRRAFNRLSPEDQALVRTISKKNLNFLVQKIQEDNNKAIEVMKKNGLQLTPAPPEDELRKFYRVGEEVSRKLTGKLFDASLLERVMSYLRELR